MLRFLADENLNNNIVRGLLRRRADVDIVRVQDVGLSGTDDRAILEWAAQERRIVLTHDVSTMTHYAYERVETDRSMPGVFEVARELALGQVIEDIILLSECSEDHEWEGQVHYLPLSANLRWVGSESGWYGLAGLSRGESELTSSINVDRDQYSFGFGMSFRFYPENAGAYAPRGALRPSVSDAAS